MARRSGHAKKIDFTHWQGAGVSFTAQAAGTAAGTLLAAQHLSETLLRTRGEWSVSMDGNSAPTPLAQITMGMILVPEGTGSTVLWSPFTDSDAPWIWWDTGVIGYEEMVTDVVDVPGLTFFRRVVDSKAMRIVRNQEMQIVIENVTVGSAATVNACFTARMLAGN